jgi:hypothetical protein
MYDNHQMQLYKINIHQFVHDQMIYEHKFYHQMMIKKKVKRFHLMDYREYKLRMDYQHQMLLLGQCNYEENCFHKLKIRMKIEETRK